MSARITFDIASVRALVSHAQAAKDHRAAFRQPAIAALWFVHDDGIYLMSSGLPLAPPVYGNGFDPRKGDCYDAAHDAVGGDDFVETFPIDEALLWIVNNPRAASFYIKVTSRSLECGVNLSRERRAARASCTENHR